MDTSETNGNGLTASVSLSRRIGLPNYSSADVFLSLSNITKETTPEEIEEMLDQTSVGFKAIAARVNAKAKEILAHWQVSGKEANADCTVCDTM